MGTLGTLGTIGALGKNGYLCGINEQIDLKKDGKEKFGYAVSYLQRVF